MYQLQINSEKDEIQVFMVSKSEDKSLGNLKEELEFDVGQVPKEEIEDMQCKEEIDLPVSVGDEMKE